MSRFRNAQWDLPTAGDIGEPTMIKAWEYVPIAVLMDIRDELQTLNRLLGCRNFTGIPAVLRAIQRNTHKPARKSKAKNAKVGTK